MPVRIDIYVQPRASKTEVAGEHDGAIKVRLAAPPVDGAANAELIAFIAGRLKIAKSNVRVVQGVTSRRKVVEVEGCSEQALKEAVIGSSGSRLRRDDEYW